MIELRCTVFIDVTLPIVPVNITRARKYWACFDTNHNAFYFGKSLLDNYNWRSIVAHEMVHQWQHEYNSDCDEGHHDRYFYGWHERFHIYNLILQEEM